MEAADQLFRMRFFRISDHLGGTAVESHRSLSRYLPIVFVLSKSPAYQARQETVQHLEVEADVEIMFACMRPTRWTLGKVKQRTT